MRPFTFAQLRRANAGSKEILNMSAVEIAIPLNPPNRKLVRCEVIYLQPNAEPWLHPTLDVDIHCPELLPIAVYEAVLMDGAESISGQYHIHDQEEAEDAQGWLFFGTFAYVSTGQEDTQPATQTYPG
jgi:hypothetical protein